MSFARTKIQPPQPRPGMLIERPALEARLGRALLESRLVLLVAAAGFGKTSALARQIAALPATTAVAWVACDEGDSPPLLFECLLAALEPYDPPWRSAPEALVRAAAEAQTPAQRRRIAAELINALDACEARHGVIVVDDLHRVQHAEVYEFLDALLERFTPRWTLVISSRSEPPLALPRLRARGEVAEFGIADLRLARDEARAVAAAAGLPAEAADRLNERAQGWAAGLRLAMNAVRGAAAGGTGTLAGGAAAIDRHLFAFLAAEVIERLEPGLRDFLLRTSVLPELSAARCAALSGDARAAERLEEIERAGLFASRLDAAEPTLRLHDLFREALEARLVREQPERVPRLYELAAAGETVPLRRIDWLLRAGAWPAAEATLGEHAESMLTEGQARQLDEALQRFPAQFRDRSPTLQRVMVLLAWSRWDWFNAIAAATRAAELYDAAGDAPAARAARSYQCIALVGANQPGSAEFVQRQLADPELSGEALARSLVAAAWAALRADQREVAPLLTRMIDTLAPIPHLSRWYECSPLPPFVGLPGTRAPLRRYLDGVRQLLPEQPTPLRGMCLILQGWLDVFEGELDRAEAAAEAARQEARWLAYPVNVHSYSRSFTAVLLALRGRGADAVAAMEAMVAELLESKDSQRVQVYLSLYTYLAMRCAAIVEDLPLLARLAERARRSDSGERAWMSAPQRASAVGYAALAAGDLVEASACWREMLAREHWSDFYGQVVETRLRLADALHRRERPATEAAAVLQPVFERVDESGEWGAVLMAGPATLTRLAAHDWAGELPAARLALLRTWAGRAQAAASGAAGSDGSPARDRGTSAAAPAAVAPTGTEPGAGGLSARELEVLERIAAGDSNKHIARAFDLSPHTVKRHVANILDKLALASRGQAAAWYRSRH